MDKCQYKRSLWYMKEKLIIIIRHVTLKMMLLIQRITKIVACCQLYMGMCWVNLWACLQVGDEPGNRPFIIRKIHLIGNSLLDCSFVSVLSWTSLQVWLNPVFAFSWPSQYSLPVLKTLLIRLAFILWTMKLLLLYFNDSVFKWAFTFSSVDQDFW